MNRLVINVIAAVMLLFLGYVAAHAVAVPHNSPCLQCHVSHNKLRDQENSNLCLTCHNYSGGAKAQRQPFAPGDAADPYGNEIPSPSLVQSSHNWAGSDTRPEAGAQPPLRPKMVYEGLAGAMACAKCHNLHGPRSSDTNSAPFLRDRNDQDQMCFDCHRSRNQQNTLGGTHSVAFDYAAVTSRFADYTAIFYKTPRSANPANPTASVNLNNGSVVCSTCHRVHYADSDSSTFDNRSSAIFGLLTPSSGYLLRTDYRGATINSVNICLNCHKGKPPHTPAADIQCVDCHGAHVEYIKPADVAAGEGTANQFLLRRYMNYSGSVKLSTYRRKAFLTTTSASLMTYRIGNGRGICESCHNLPTNVEEHSTVNSRSDCNVCHDAHGSVPATRRSPCLACHGGVVRPFNNLSTNSHFRHVSSDPITGMQYGCVICHVATVSDNITICDKTKHLNGINEVAFWGALAAGTAWNGTTCSTSYCHSDGKGNYVTSSWSNRSAGKCGSCHAANATLAGAGKPTIATDGHAAHLGAAYGLGSYLGSDLTSCQICHTAYATETGATHVNHSIEYAAGPGSSCATCHPGTVPAWNAAQHSLDCRNCHGAVPSRLPNGVSAPVMTTNFSDKGHGKYPGSTACTTCHDNNSAHVTGALGATARLQAELTGTFNADCNYCHNNAASIPTAGFLNMSTHFTVKGSGQTMACAVCHEPHGTTNLSMIKKIIKNKTVSYTISYTDRSADWVDTSSKLGLCQICHTATKYYQAGVAERNHATTRCFDCHAHNAAGGAFLPAGTCNACHGYPPAAPTLVSGVDFGTMSDWSSAGFEKYSGGGGAHLVAAHVRKSARVTEGWNPCTMCHGGDGSHQKLMPVNTHISNITLSLDSQYRFSDGFIVYTGAKLVNSPQKNVTGSCYNTSCHMSPSPRWGAVGPTTCETCHQMPPRDSSLGIREAENGAVKGNHETHGSGSRQACAKCHGESVLTTYGNSHAQKTIS